MLYGLLVSLFVFVCILLVIIVLLQQSKSSMGLGALGGSTQMLFGGSGGQDVFQKTTWVLGALFMGGSLVLSLMRTRHFQEEGAFRPQPAPMEQSAPVSQPTEPVAELPTAE